MTNIFVKNKRSMRRVTNYDVINTVKLTIPVPSTFKMLLLIYQLMQTMVAIKIYREPVLKVRVNSQPNKKLNHEIRIPKRDVAYIVLSVYLLTLIHRHPLNEKQSH